MFFYINVLFFMMLVVHFDLLTICLCKANKNSSLFTVLNLYTPSMQSIFDDKCKLDKVQYAHVGSSNRNSYSTPALYIYIDDLNLEYCFSLKCYIMTQRLSRSMLLRPHPPNGFISYLDNRL